MSLRLTKQRREWQEKFLEELGLHYEFKPRRDLDLQIAKAYVDKKHELCAERSKSIWQIIRERWL